MPPSVLLYSFILDAIISDIIYSIVSKMNKCTKWRSGTATESYNKELVSFLLQVPTLRRSCSSPGKFLLAINTFKPLKDPPPPISINH